MNELLNNNKRLFWCNLCYFIILSLFVVWRIISSLGIIKLDSVYKDLIFTLVTQLLILFAVPLIIYTCVFKQKPKQIFQAFGYRKVGFKVILCSIGMGFIAFFVIMFVSSFFSIFIQMLGYEPYVAYGESKPMSVGIFFLQLLTVAVMPGMFEEFSNRGMLLSGFSKINATKAIVLSGLLFGLMHLNINQFFYAFVVGMLLATVALVTRSIWPSVIIHFMNNGINTYLDFASSNDLFGANFTEAILMPEVNIFARFILYIVLLSLIMFFGVWLLIQMYKQTKKEQFMKFAREFSGIKDPKQQIDIENAKELLQIYLTQGKSIDMDLMSLSNKNNADADNKNLGYGNENVTSQVVISDANGQTTVMQVPNSNQKVPKSSLGQLMNIILPDSPKDYKPTFKENFFLYCSIFLGSVITIMTFIWGLF